MDTDPDGFADLVARVHDYEANATDLNLWRIICAARILVHNHELSDRPASL